MTDMVERQLRISTMHALHLEQMAAAHNTTEEALIAEALDAYFVQGDNPAVNAKGELCPTWRASSSGTSERIWDNASDAQYDNENESAFIAERIGLLTVQELQEVAQRIAAAAGLPCPKFP